MFAQLALTDHFLSQLTIPKCFYLKIDDVFHSPREGWRERGKGVICFRVFTCRPRSELRCKRYHEFGNFFCPEGNLERNNKTVSTHTNLGKGGRSV